MNGKNSKDIQEHDQVAQARPPILTEGNRLAPDVADRGAGTRVEGTESGQPSSAAALTGDNGGGTSGNHGNGTAG